MEMERKGPDPSLLVYLPQNTLAVFTGGEGIGTEYDRHPNFAAIIHTYMDKAPFSIYEPYAYHAYVRSCFNRPSN